MRSGFPRIVLLPIPCLLDQSAALVELTSASEPVDNDLDIHAVDITDEDYKMRTIASIFVDEERLEET
ncbi:hypothetical protein C7999DRAFT_36520 [Corynascus novoguineensis]|uniref:Uncharacterized protein n=1 Tax=Corynascus novoguineensis TaxID=1126955 RepID=A0AAN7CJB6_9PEZI|nr:hypothetical protein C7999DRAFT_36520 [Corynascus novoguineensis]